MNKKKLLRAGLFALSLGLSLSGLSHADCGGSDGSSCGDEFAGLEAQEVTVTAETDPWVEPEWVEPAWTEPVVFTDPDPVPAAGGDGGGDFQVTTDLDTGKTTTTGTEPTEPVLAVNDPNLTLVTNVTGTTSELPAVLQTALDQQTLLLSGTLAPTDPNDPNLVLQGTVFGGAPSLTVRIGEEIAGGALSQKGAQIIGNTLYTGQSAAEMANAALKELQVQYAQELAQTMGTPVTVQFAGNAQTTLLTDLTATAQELLDFFMKMAKP